MHISAIVDDFAAETWRRELGDVVTCIAGVLMNILVFDLHPANSFLRGLSARTKAGIEWSRNGKQNVLGPIESE